MNAPFDAPGAMNGAFIAVRPYGEDPVTLLIRDGLIAAIGSNVDTAGAEVIDAGGLIAQRSDRKSVV